MNRLNNLPPGFGAFPNLEILDLTYNNLNENSLPANFWELCMYTNTVWSVLCDHNFLQTFLIKYFNYEKFDHL